MFRHTCAAENNLTERSRLGSPPPRPEVINPLSKYEITPLVHSEKFDMKRIEIEVCGQQLPNGYTC